MSLRCFISGHSWNLNHVDSEGLHHLICDSCGKTIKCNSNIVCKMTKNHDWRPCGAQHYSFHDPFSDDSVTMDVRTRRSWKCHICGEIKQDSDRQMISGFWYALNGEFITEQDAKKRGYAVKEKYVEDL